MKDMTNKLEDDERNNEVAVWNSKASRRLFLKKSGVASLGVLSLISVTSQRSRASDSSGEETVWVGYIYTKTGDHTEDVAKSDWDNDPGGTAQWLFNQVCNAAQQRTDWEETGSDDDYEWLDDPECEDVSTDGTISIRNMGTYYRVTIDGPITIKKRWRKKSS